MTNFNNNDMNVTPVPRIFKSELNIIQVLQDAPGSLFLYISPRGILSKWKLTEDRELQNYDTGEFFTDPVGEFDYDFVYLTRIRLN